ncbi:MAG: hypothetical protein LBI82_03180 [Dysgonamonadaceae bacterium]|nr:hypothetical protein [Dysgonamonadaceae bacterium]
MKRISLVLAIILITFTNCNKDRKFSEVRNLSEFEKTDFIPTIEHKINGERNSVYCVTLLYAWNEIKEKIKLPLEIPEENCDLTLLNASKSFVGVLKSNEYVVSGNVDGELITAKAEFSKSLPFEIKLEEFKNKLVFDGQSVASFGITGYSDYEKLKIVRIGYYENDNNFIIKLLPKDKNHEVILFKTGQPFYSIAEMVNEIEKLIEIGKTEKKNEKLSWKYYYADEDEIVIPKFNFNIETNYSTLEGNKLKTEKTNYQIERAWQRTAFILDENGAEIESEAEMEAVVEEVIEDYERPKPKKMIFDKPFLILLKRTDAKNPYFGLWTTNSELMIKE